MIDLLEAIAKIALLLGGMMTAAAYFVLLERWMAAWIQDRRGPNRVGVPLTNIKMFGLGQPLADGVKMLLKEDVTPAHVDKRLFVIAPIIIMTAALAIFAVIPFGSVTPPVLPVEPGSETTRPIELVIAPGVDVGMLYVFALSSIAVYGVILGGWASNNKYSFLGGLRSSAQLIAYEIPLGLGILGVVLASGSLDLSDIITHQATSGIWNAISQPLGFVVFVIAAFAEAARLPFDLPEAEQELIGGYHTEYGGMKLVLFLTAEFIHMITASFLIVILFLGGWHFWGITGSGDEVTWFTAILRILVLAVKILLVILFFMLVRWSWPRFRFDQLMAFAWKVMMPLGMVNLLAMVIIVEIERTFADQMNAFTRLLLILASWGVLVGGWVVVSLAQPMTSDNRPRERMGVE
jgi:NADH-quinone oxidoreductase subunit H